MKINFKYKTRLIIFLIPIIFISFLFLGGYRFTALQAVKSSLSTNKDIKVFGEVKRDWGIVYLLETKDGIKTALAERKGLLWNCDTSIYFLMILLKMMLLKL